MFGSLFTSMLTLSYASLYASVYLPLLSSVSTPSQRDHIPIDKVPKGEASAIVVSGDQMRAFTDEDWDQVMSHQEVSTN